MLKNLFRARSTPARAPARAPSGERLYAIGDIHGCADLLDRLIQTIAKDAAGARMRAIFLGDYIDRGPDSRGVLDRLVALKRARPETIFLKGNHEAAFLDFLAAPESTRGWLDWGGAETLDSYGVADLSRPPVVIAEEMLTRLPADHLAFLKGLDLMRVFGDYVFVHAGVRPGVALDEQDEDDLLWIREEFHRAPVDERPDKVVVHGHHPVKKALDAGWRIDVDTGACFTGRLTAVILDGTDRRFVS
ncbi:MAG: metallophosphoesterase family protein, partial [Amphiplicatus sp.]